MHGPGRIPYEETAPTRHLVHMSTQMMGKARLALAPPVNHSWHVALAVTPRGLTTGAMPYGVRALEIDLDLREGRLTFLTSDPAERVLTLGPVSVADLHAAFVEALEDLGTPTRIWPVPVETPDPVPFDEDDAVRAYDVGHATALADAILQAYGLLERYRAPFVGKSSPVQFFWGGFDLAVSRFSGRLAPPHPSMPGLPDSVVADAYSHEVASAGWWPGNDAHPAAAFYAYAYPEPAGYRLQRPGPEGLARYDERLHEFVLDAAVAAAAPDPEATVLRFLDDAYVVAADHAEWDRLRLERPAPPSPRQAAAAVHASAGGRQR